MNKTIATACKSLDELANLVTSNTNENRPLSQVHGWHHPAMSRDDLARIPTQLSKRLKEANITELDKALEEALASIPARLKTLHGNTIAHMFNGHGHQAIPAYMSTMQWVEHLTDQLFKWEHITDTKAMPASLARRIRSLSTQVNNVSVDTNKLEKQIQLINDATSAAESLPTDLESLKEARVKIDKQLEESFKDREKISNYLFESDSYSSKIKENKEDTDKLVDKCEEAYRITTTKGLAAAFEQRAKKLAASMWVWVFGLLSALGVGAIIGAERINLLNEALKSATADPSIIVLHIILSVLSLGAPLWFAWLATKQIGQRFRLAEDYAYKASVAKAYEGYRKEASRIDEALEARLFSTALTRVEEAPLRLVDHESHGSPWHELVSSEAFQSAMKNIPELRDKFIEIAKDGVEATKSVAKRKTEKAPKATPDEE